MSLSGDEAAAVAAAAAADTLAREAAFREETGRVEEELGGDSSS